tara:strand:- start:92182 stop:93147 length:966 start_codon:yes stop_codon:yes gene_type:complete
MPNRTVGTILVYSFLIISVSQLSAQNGKDYIVTHIRDTLWGTVERDDDYFKIGEKIKFEDSGGSKRIYFPADIKAFKIRNEYYESIIARKRDKLIGLKAEKNVFAKRMISGPLSLFKHSYTQPTPGGLMYGNNFSSPSKDITDFYITIDNEKPVLVNPTLQHSGDEIFFTDFPEIHEKMMSDKTFTINLAAHEHNKKLKKLVEPYTQNKFLKEGKVRVLLVRKPSYIFNGDLKIKLDKANVSTLKENQFLDITLSESEYYDLKLTGKGVKKSVSFYGRTDNVIFLEFATGDISTILPITMEKALQYMESAEEIAVDLSRNN